ncbi:unnamed protein product [Bursaphelenchus okinawaensis]|uniref:Uncharacterized protein n=1 Tax=Bursaphelenchus okinawaensis TaxID=465554 RepID=A0A811LSD0_9BILA|nr:unnamed protein product [Bursaphelenchus okinawaensis]CAG9127678.1 unnamed protein product [Bursaphelenchus okinawaensis]
MCNQKLTNENVSAAKAEEMSRKRPASPVEELESAPAAKKTLWDDERKAELVKDIKLMMNYHLNVCKPYGLMDVPEDMAANESDFDEQYGFRRNAHIWKEHENDMLEFSKQRVDKEVESIMDTVTRATNPFVIVPPLKNVVRPSPPAPTQAKHPETDVQGIMDAVKKATNPFPMVPPLKKARTTSTVADTSGHGKKAKEGAESSKNNVMEIESIMDAVIKATKPFPIVPPLTTSPTAPETSENKKEQRNAKKDKENKDPSEAKKTKKEKKPPNKPAPLMRQAMRMMKNCRRSGY